MAMLNMFITILGGLTIFLFGMKIMSDGLQKVAGAKMKTILGAMTSNRFAGVGTGTLVTCAVQSSSATTVMLVSFVSAGLITLTQSLGVIMGANIGTTLTGWLVALLGFKFKIIILAFPAIILGFLPKLLGARRLTDWGEVLLGFGILFLGLDFMKDSVGHLKESEVILQFMQNARADTLVYRLGTVLVGAIVTMVVQSSSATMAITLTLAAQGIIDVPTACALVLGENIGTTITANLAALNANIAAKQTARAHMLFNIFGVLWGIFLFTPYLSFIDWIVPGDVMSGEGASKAIIAAHVAMFHSLFNVTNTFLFIPFVSQLAWLSKKLVWAKETETAISLKYLDPHIIESPPMALHAARQELIRMTVEVSSMLNRVLMLIASPNKKLGKVAAAINASENTVDYLEKEIIEYLVTISRGETSLEQSQEIAGYIGAVSDIERMGDHCESLVKLLAKRYDQKLELTYKAKKDLTEIGGKVSEFISFLIDNLNDPTDSIMVIARNLEKSINTMKKQMRREHVERLNIGSCQVISGLIFIDMLTSFEKMGDHAFNVAQMLAGER